MVASVRTDACSLRSPATPSASRRKRSSQMSRRTTCLGFEDECRRRRHAGGRSRLQARALKCDDGKGNAAAAVYRVDKPRRPASTHARSFLLIEASLWCDASGGPPGDAQVYRVRKTRQATAVRSRGALCPAAGAAIYSDSIGVTARPRIDFCTLRAYGRDRPTPRWRDRER